MRDKLDRPLRDLRISVTDRCNLRCRYCMPREVYGADYAFLPRSELLSFEEIARIVRVLAEQGVDKLRLTGGEPLLRRDLERLVELLAGIEGIDDIALTTNGLLLHDDKLERLQALVQIQKWHMQQFADFLKKMAATPDGEGSLLDHSIFMYGSNMSNSNLHNNYPIPNLIVGGGNGKLKQGGQHLVLPERTPIANLHLTLLQKVGHEQDHFGDSTGTITGV